MGNPETIKDILREMRGHDEPGRLVFGQEVGRLADRIEAAWNRERVAIEADALNAGALLEVFRRNDKEEE